jgi:thioredoxin-related protein
MSLRNAMGHRYASVLLALALLLPASIRAQAQGPEPVALQWQVLDDAMRTAKAKKKSVFVMVYADWCGYCHRMEATTFRDPRIVAKMAGSFVPVKLNGESPRILKLETGAISEGQWAMRQGVQGFPSLIVLDSRGRTVVQYPGYLTTPQTFQVLSDLEEFFAKGGIDRLGNFPDWIQKKG